MDFDYKYSRYLKMVNEAIEEYIPPITGSRGRIYEAMRYSMQAGGKRVRPILMLAVCDIFGYDLKDAMPFAVAIEMIHTYSLIHDDLPAMDNDDLRRGIPTNHKVFGDGVAILAGDGLLNMAFEVMSRAVARDKERAYVKAKAMSLIAECAGVSGMLGGQLIDLESEGKQVSAELLSEMRSLKTGALLRAPVISAAILCNVDDKTKIDLSIYSSGLGLAFQIRDDILDVEGRTESLGKTCGSDENNQKSTFVTVFGLDGAKESLKLATDEALQTLGDIDKDVSFLKELAIRLSEREN